MHSAKGNALRTQFFSGNFPGSEGVVTGRKDFIFEKKKTFIHGVRQLG